MLSLVIIFNLFTYLFFFFNKSHSLNNPSLEISINQEILPEKNNSYYPEDLDEINYNIPIFEEKKDLDELNVNDDEGNDDEIYYLDNLTEENGTFFDEFSNFSFESSLVSYKKQGLLINIIMAFLANVIIFYWISCLKNLLIK